MPSALLQSLKNITAQLQSDKMIGGVEGRAPNLQFESFPGVHMGHVSVYYNGSMIVLSGFKGYKVIPNLAPLFLVMLHKSWLLLSALT